MFAPANTAALLKNSSGPLLRWRGKMFQLVLEERITPEGKLIFWKENNRWQNICMEFMAR